MAKLIKSEVDREMGLMGNPLRWPRAILPVMNIDRYEHGILVDLPVARHLVFHVLFFDKKVSAKIADAVIKIVVGEEPEIKVSRYHSYEEIIADGWRVD